MVSKNLHFRNSLVTGTLISYKGLGKWLPVTKTLKNRWHDKFKSLDSLII